MAAFLKAVIIIVIEPSLKELVALAHYCTTKYKRIIKNNALVCII
jgi:hypothetical protein